MSNTTPGYKLIGRFGLKADLRGAHVTWTVADRDYTAEVTGMFERNGFWMLNVRHLNGESIEPVALSIVGVLNRA